MTKDEFLDEVVAATEDSLWTVTLVAPDGDEYSLTGNEREIDKWMRRTCVRMLGWKQIKLRELRNEDEADEALGVGLPG